MFAACRSDASPKHPEKNRKTLSDQPLCRPLINGDVYVGRNSKGEAGKVNIEDGKMFNIWCHKQGQSEKCELLVLRNGCRAGPPRARGDRRLHIGPFKGPYC